MGIIDSYTSNSLPGGALAAIGHLFIRFFQFILGIAVIGLYAQDISRASHLGQYSDSNWVYAVVVSTISVIVAFAFMMPKVPWWRGGFIMDGCLLILWIALFGDFGAKYLHADPNSTKKGDGLGIERMKNAVWVDLTCVLLWLTTTVWGVGLWLSSRRKGGLGRRTEI
jgi:hypothetical protein